MDNQNYYMASCWSTTDSSNAADMDADATQFVLGIHDEIMPLDAGLKRMEQDGWTLINIQPNPMKSSGAVLRTPPAYFYLFERDLIPRPRE